MRHIAVAGFEFGAALGQLFVGKLDVHRTVRDINGNDVAVLDQGNRALVCRLGSDMADGQTGGAAGIAAVGQHGDLLADTLALDERRWVQHLLHARAALRALVTDDQRHTGLQSVVEDDLDGLFLGFDDQCRSTEGPNLLRHTGGLHHAAVRGEVATQHGQTAFGDGRMIDVVNRAVHTVAVEGVEQRGMRPRIRGHDVTRGRQIHLLGFLGAGITHDVPVVEFVLKRLVIDGMHVAVQLAGTVELAENASDATGAMHVGDLPFAGRRSLADAGHGVGYALDVVKREVHVGGLRHGEDMQHCIGGATHGHIHGHGVLERFLGGDGTREHSLVIIVVILLGDLDDLLGGALEQILAVGVRSQNGAIAWQGQADGLGQAVHRIRGEHAGAGTTGRADGLLIGEQILFVQIVVGGGIHHVDQIGVLLHGSVGKYRGAGLHRTAGDEDGRDVQTQSGH